ncbi:transcription factor IIA [Colletotrichum higginsianum]|nr:transcription factor IIA [Colletotrichum higginsianum]
MSNNAVGVVYEQIINEVISSSRVDFEEGGVDESVLEELKKGWQEKLSQLEVASFSWDPKEAPAPVAPPPTTAAPPPAAPYSQAQLSPQIPGPGLSLPGAPLADHARNAPVKEEPYIKQEPGVQNLNMSEVNSERKAPAPSMPFKPQRPAGLLASLRFPRCLASLRHSSSSTGQARPSKVSRNNNNNNNNNSVPLATVSQV